MKLIDVIGPYSAPTAWQRECNVRAAEAQWRKLWSAGVSAICVHTMCRNVHDEVPESKAIEMDNEMLRRCDAVLLCPGWQNSKGTVDELNLAVSLGKMCFYPDQVADCIAWATDDDGTA